MTQSKLDSESVELIQKPFHARFVLFLRQYSSDHTTVVQDLRWRLSAISSGYFFEVTLILSINIKKIVSIILDAINIVVFPLKL